MNWEAIGAIGEIIGAFGVIVTLIYLAENRNYKACFATNTKVSS